MKALRSQERQNVAENQTSAPLVGQWRGRQSTCPSYCELCLLSSGMPYHRLLSTSDYSLILTDCTHESLLTVP